jgi:NAD(P)-dependent dehydrogenase (short-subunit alcohol dehydrogenase family)
MISSLDILLARRGVRVHAVLTGFVDTDLTRNVNLPKASQGTRAPVGGARASARNGMSNGTP